MQTYDAIVVGSGISGGWAAKELCEKGLKTLLLERGPNVEHIKDYTTATMDPWQFKHHLYNSETDKAENPIQSKVYNEASKHFFVNDKEHPYIQDTPFSWIRGYQVGGRSLTWGRQCYRLSDLDFEANAKDGHAIDWPIRYKDIAPWYDYVENYIGVSGKAEGLPQLPDGKFLPPFDLNCVEDDFSKKIKSKYKDRVVTVARVANLSRGWNGRGPCQARNQCDRGCPFGGYFSSNAATLPAAALTGNLFLVPNAIVTELIYDDQKNKVTGVRVIDAVTKNATEYFSKIIFLNASTIATAAILLRSVSKRFPNGLGNASGQVGRNLMDHFTFSGAKGEHPGLKDKYYYGRRPSGIYVPRFQNTSPDNMRKDFVRGYGFQGIGERLDWNERSNDDDFGVAYKENLTTAGPWTMLLGTYGETLPYEKNGITLDKDKKDQWGLPILHISLEYGANEDAMRKDGIKSAEEMMHVAGMRNISTFDYRNTPGLAVHEMGTARMGRDPKTSVLNGNNQIHEAKNVFITDGSFMTSSGCQNPSLTYMALTARACNFAVSELKKMNL
jgi:choline dehydrogenase-like flavoprotein